MTEFSYAARILLSLSMLESSRHGLYKGERHWGLRDEKVEDQEEPSVAKGLACLVNTGP